MESAAKSPNLDPAFTAASREASQIWLLRVPVGMCASQPRRVAHLRAEDEAYLLPSRFPNKSKTSLG